MITTIGHSRKGLPHMASEMTQRQRAEVVAEQICDAVNTMAYPSGTITRLVWNALQEARQAEGVEEGSAQWKKTNAEYERVAKAHSRLSETTDCLIRALEMAQPVVCSMLCPSVKKTGEEWLHVQKCDSISLTLRTAKSMYAGYARAAKIEEGE